jgi:hypothetical protein
VSRPGRTPARTTWILVALAFTATTSPARMTAQAALYGPDSALVVTLRTDLKSLLKDRDTTKTVWREATLGYAGPGGPIAVPLRVRTRGSYRLLNCDFPPIRLRFSDSAAAHTPFDGLRRPKLATHCRDTDEYEQYVLEEYAIYRLLGLFTPVSLSVRLLRVTYDDAAGATRPVTRYAFVSEDPEQMAMRLGGTLLTQRGARIGTLSRSHAALLGVFEYFIANTDWSVPALHNIALLKARDTTFAVPYDFDWSGVIGTPYARPAPILPIRSVRERIYRGFCQSAADLEPVLARFEALRDTIAALYRAIPGLQPRVVERTLRYDDAFYRTIADRSRFMREVVQRDCIP